MRGIGFSLCVFSQARRSSRNSARRNNRQNILSLYLSLATSPAHQRKIDTMLARQSPVALGEMRALEAVAAGYAAGALAEATAAGAAFVSMRRPDAEAVSSGTCSPGFTIQPIVWPTGITSPACAFFTPARIPVSRRLDFRRRLCRISTSKSGSPLEIASPSFFARR